MEAAESGLAIVAGSGMGALAGALARGVEFHDTVSFESLAGVGTCTVDGHRGEVKLGRAVGVGSPVAVVSGRRHLYEGADSTMEPLVRWLESAGFRRLITISAAGAVHGGIDPGEIVIVQEIIDAQNRIKFYGGGRDPVRFRPSRGLTGELERAAARARTPLVRGILACSPGPAYETPAEVYMYQCAGADVATMSAAPEARFALELGMEVAIIAAVTNRGTGIGYDPPAHGRVMDQAESMCRPLGDILLEMIASGDDRGD